jgi:hypothetical protein
VFHFAHSIKPAVDFSPEERHCFSQLASKKIAPAASISMAMPFTELVGVVADELDRAVPLQYLPLHATYQFSGVEAPLGASKKFALAESCAIVFKIQDALTFTGFKTRRSKLAPLVLPSGSPSGASATEAPEILGSAANSSADPRAEKRTYAQMSLPQCIACGQNIATLKSDVLFCICECGNFGFCAQSGAANINCGCGQKIDNLAPQTIATLLQQLELPSTGNDDGCAPIEKDVTAEHVEEPVVVEYNFRRGELATCLVNVSLAQDEIKRLLTVVDTAKMERVSKQLRTVYLPALNNSLKEYDRFAFQVLCNADLRQALGRSGVTCYELKSYAIRARKELLAYDMPIYLTCLTSPARRPRRLVLPVVVPAAAAASTRDSYLFAAQRGLRNS